MSDDNIDLTDAAARNLLLCIGDKAAEPFGVDTPEKTLREWRVEMAKLTTEAMFWSAAWRANLKR